MVNAQSRSLARTLGDVVHRLSQMDPVLAEALRDNLSHGQLEILVQDLSEAGCKAALLRPAPRSRAKGSAA